MNAQNKGHKMANDKNMNQDHRITRLECVIENINANFVDIKQGMRDLTKRIDDLDKKFEAKFDKLDNRLWQLGILIATSIIGVIVSKIFHWI